MNRAEGAGLRTHLVTRLAPGAPTNRGAPQCYEGSPLAMTVSIASQKASTSPSVV